MPIVVKCPICGVSLQFADEAAGQQTWCPSCKQAIALPGGPEAATSARPSSPYSTIPPGGGAAGPYPTQPGGPSPYSLPPAGSPSYGAPTPGMPGPTDAYGWGPGSMPQNRRTSLLAVTALILAVILPPIGLVLAIVALIRNRSRPDLSGNGFAVAGLCVSGVVMVIGLMIAILLPALGSAMEAGRRAQCASNLRGLANTLKLYAQSYDDQYPAIGRGMMPDGTPGTPDAIDTQASLWLLVSTGKSAPEAFICPSDKDAKAFKGVAEMMHPFPEVDANGLPKDTSDFKGRVITSSTLGGHRSWSYSYQVPNGMRDSDRWRRREMVGNPGTPNNNNTKFAIMADRAPFHDDLLIPPGSVKDAATGQAWLNNLRATDKMKVNSPNHGGDGQNVLFQDGHVKFCLHPWCGINDDNIYTRATGPVQGSYGNLNSSARTVGTKCGTTDGPFDDDDSVLCNIQEGVWCR